MGNLKLSSNRLTLSRHTAKVSPRAQYVRDRRRRQVDMHVASVVVNPFLAK